MGGFWKYGCRSDTIRNTLANHRTGGDPYGGGGWETGPQRGFEPPPRDPETTPVGYYNGSSYLLYEDGERSYCFTTEDGRSYYGCYDMSGNVSELVNRRDGDAWTPARMGDNWWNPLPSDWNLADTSYPAPVEGGWSSTGFRLARTAP